LFVSDATATHTNFEHNIALNSMMLAFANVVSTADVTSLMKAGLPPRAFHFSVVKVCARSVGFFPTSD
jgi:hypothetical protein